MRTDAQLPEVALPDDAFASNSDAKNPFPARRMELRLDAERVAALGENLHCALRDIVKSTRYELSPDGLRFRVVGPDRSYHVCDAELQIRLGKVDLSTVHRREGKLCFCHEDSWSGLFMAEALTHVPYDQSLVILHVDDHQDMMPTLLVRNRDGKLIDSGTGQLFEPMVPSDWNLSIASGAIGIGNFLTPFLHLGREVHIRHLNNRFDDAVSEPIGPGVKRYDLIPEYEFATVDRGTEGKQTCGTFQAHMNAARLLDDLPDGLLIVHIDLDYFINDFNGNPGGVPQEVDAALSAAVQAKIARLFSAIAQSGRKVDRWIFATSPGFCASRHWAELLGRLAEPLAALEGASDPREFMQRMLTSVRRKERRFAASEAKDA